MWGAHMEQHEAVGRALQAARRGDLDAIEIELTYMTGLPPEAIVGLRVKLRGLARSVRSHPSYRAEPAQQAG
jgi:hypothetical protein